jgi:hypothetical protein
MGGRRQLHFPVAVEVVDAAHMGEIFSPCLSALVDGQRSSYPKELPHKTDQERSSRSAGIELCRYPSRSERGTLTFGT